MRFSHETQFQTVRKNLLPLLRIMKKVISLFIAMAVYGCDLLAAKPSVCKLLLKRIRNYFICPLRWSVRVSRCRATCVKTRLTASESVP